MSRTTDSIIKERILKLSHIPIDSVHWDSQIDDLTLFLKMRKNDQK